MPVTVKGVTLGEGRPKIIVPLTGTTRTDLLAEARALADVALDLVEWRIDHFADLDAAPGTGRELAALLDGRPLLLTFRSADEGGERELSDEAYAQLLLAAAEGGVADLLDVELSRPAAVVRTVLDGARRAGVPVVMSHHDFAATPPEADIVALLNRMHALGADVAKVAVMPRTPADVLALLGATWQVASGAAGRPVITVAMGQLGVASRLAGGVFGSAATFASVGRASAPGQVPAGALRDALQLLHR